MNITGQHPYELRVGGPGADVEGYSCQAIQYAITRISQTGGKIILDPGVYKIHNPIRLSNKIVLEGEDQENTVLRKVDGFRSPFTIDADFGELQVTVADPSGFKPGMGVTVQSGTRHEGWDVSTAIIAAVEGNVLILDTRLERNYSADDEPLVTNACSVVAGVGVRDAVVTGLTVEGNADSNDRLNGCRGGGIYLYRSSNCAVRDVTVKDFNGDGISWQITRDILVKDCTVAGCADSGLHPGSGSVRSVVEGCDVSGCGADGIYVCWRVQRGIFRDSRLHDNGGAGLNIGHKDTDNLITGNHIHGNGAPGILFRTEKESNGAHRNIISRNIIENNVGAGIRFDAPNRDTVIDDNIIRDTVGGTQTGTVLVHDGVENLKETGTRSGADDAFTA